MTDADALVETLIQVAHRWSKWADACERRLRHFGDRETLEAIHERTFKWSCQLRRRGSSCRYWEQICFALRDVAKTGRVDFEGLPASILEAVKVVPKGYFIPGEEHREASEILGVAQWQGRHEGPELRDGKWMSETARVNPKRRGGEND